MVSACEGCEGEGVQQRGGDKGGRVRQGRVQLQVDTIYLISAYRHSAALVTFLFAHMDLIARVMEAVGVVNVV